MMSKKVLYVRITSCKNLLLVMTWLLTILERFPIGTMRKLHVQKVLIRIASTTYSLNISWDPYISSTHYHSNTYIAITFPDLLLIQRTFLPPHWFRLELKQKFLDHYDSLIEMLCARVLISSIQTCSSFLISIFIGINVLKPERTDEENND